MRSKRKILSPTLALVALMLAGAPGCTTRSELTPEGEVAVVLSDDKKTNAVTAQLRNLIAITLPVPKAPGYRWQISFHDVRYLKQMTDIVPGKTPDAGPTISFMARLPGRTRVRFLLLPDTNDRVATPVDAQEVVLAIEFTAAPGAARPSARVRVRSSAPSG